MNCKSQDGTLNVLVCLSGGVGVPGVVEGRVHSVHGRPAATQDGHQ